MEKVSLRCTNLVQKIITPDDAFEEGDFNDDDVGGDIITNYNYVHDSLVQESLFAAERRIADSSISSTRDRTYIELLAASTMKY
jgi:hypothetical protein